MIAVPTTAGTGSEMSNALVVTEGSTGRKLAVLADPGSQRICRAERGSHADTARKNDHRLRT